MWCSTCQRDVPALSSPGSGRVRCTKCASDLAGAAEGQTSPDSLTTQPASSSSAVGSSPLHAALGPSALVDSDWKLEADLRGVRRLVASLKSHSPACMAEHLVPAPHMATSWSPLALDQSKTVVAQETHTRADLPQSRSHVAGWTVLSLGLAIFSCGAVLLGWSIVGGRVDLWPIGMPLTLIGQAGLIVGLVLQLDGLWSTSRKTAAVLSELDGELKNVRQATTLLSSSHAASGQSFYLHLAEGASPQMLLADLKGQMDLLAQQMARHTR